MTTQESLQLNEALKTIERMNQRFDRVDEKLHKVSLEIQQAKPGLSEVRAEIYKTSTSTILMNFYTAVFIHATTIATVGLMFKSLR
jgi:archaellum component FlaC